MPFQAKSPWDYMIKGVEQGAGMGPAILQAAFREKALKQENEAEERAIKASVFEMIKKAKTPEEAKSYKELSESILDSIGISHTGAPEFTPPPLPPKPSMMIGEKEITGPMAEILGKVGTEGREEYFGVEDVETPLGTWKLVTSKAGEQYWENAETGERKPSIGYEASQGRKDTTFANETTLRKEFGALPVVKDWNILDRQFQMMQKAHGKSQEMRVGKEEAVYGPIDQTLIMVFNKMLDPTSVVRESEFARTPTAMAMWERLKAKADRIFAGGVISHNERKALVNMAEEFHKIYKRRHKETVKQYRGYAVQYGFNPNRISPSVSEKLTKESTRTVVKTGVDQRTGKTVIQFSDGTIEYAE